MTDTTPLITLAGIGLLDLLPLLYGRVWAPRIVLDEYQAKAPPTEPDLTQASIRPYITQMQSQGRPSKNIDKRLQKQ